MNAPLQTAIICSRGGRGRKCCACHLQGGFQCYWKGSGTKTCDAFICPEHALEIDKNKHLCPAHQEAYKAWKKQRAAKASA